MKGIRHFALAVAAVASFVGFAEAALYDKNQKLVKSHHLYDPEVYWPYVSNEGDTRFSGVGLINYKNSVTCAATLVKSWRGQLASPFVRLQKAYALTSGSCYNTYTNEAERNRFSFNQPPTPGLDTIQFNRTLANVKKPQFHVWAGIENVEFSTVNLTDVSIVRLNLTIGDLIDKGLRFYPIARNLPKTGETVSAIHFVDAINDFVMKRAPGLFVNTDPVFIGDLLRFEYAFKVNWGTAGAPIFDTSYNIVSMVSAIDTDTNSGPQLDEMNHCFDFGSGWFDFSHATCLKKFKWRVNDLYGIRLPGYIGPSAKFPRQ